MTTWFVGIASLCVRSQWNADGEILALTGAIARKKDADPAFAIPASRLISRQRDSLVRIRRTCRNTSFSKTQVLRTFSASTATERLYRALVRAKITMAIFEANAARQAKDRRLYGWRSSSHSDA
jgi:hypothetical protein